MESAELADYYRRRAGEYEAIYAKPERQADLARWSHVLLLDNRFVGGNSTPLVSTDAAGNTYQDRRLADGSVTRIVKNFPTGNELRRCLGADLAYQELDYYWLAEYRR